jgi:uncharacterized protein
MPNPIVHFEIGCRDRAKTAEFYSSLFDWRVEEKDGRTMLRTGTDVGGHINSLGHEPHNYTLFYVLVDNLVATLAKVSELGGKTLVPPMAVPGGGRFAWFRDVEGSVIGIYEDTRA